MSEEGETGFDAGHAPDAPPTALVKSPVAGELPRAESAAAKPGPSEAAADMGVDPRGTHGAGHGPRYAEDEYHQRREPRSRSRPRNGAAPYDSRPPARRESRGDDAEYHDGAYRQSRYDDRDYSRSGYYRRYERESPRYKRRESGRSGYSRGYPGREEPEGEYAVRRDIDKDRAIEELRCRVRAGTDRPADEAIPLASERGRSPLRASVAVPPPATQQPPAAAEAERSQAIQSAAAVTTDGATAEQKAVMDMDDLEEGEHVEGVMDVDTPQYPASGTADAPPRSSSRGRDDYGRGRGVSERSRSRHRDYREHSRPRSDSRSRGYPGPPSYEPDSRRSGNYRDYPGRRYDDRYDHRPRESYSGRAGHSSRYSGRRGSPPRMEPYRPERRYSSRYERHGESEAHRPPFEDMRSPRQPRSRSPLPPPAARSDSSRGRNAYGDQYRRGDRSASRGDVPRSRSPRGYSRGADAGDYAHDAAAQDYRRSRWPGSGRQPASPPRHAADDGAPMAGGELRQSPPPPPPMPHSSSMHGSQYGRASPSPYDQERSPPYRGYPPRSQRRRSRTPKGSMQGPPSSRAPYGGRYEYEGHSRDPSSGGHYQGYGSRAPSPGANSQHYGAGGEAPPPPPPAAPELSLPPFSYGTDLYITRQPESGEWLEVRQQVRDQTRRILELSARARKTGFELGYADWGVLKADSQVQMALQQVERAEQGLDASDRSLMDTSPAEL
ncbi:hypothetical protein H4S01_004909 [Coemansia sp. RSA 2610]|nr:hypothetical protein H4S01_004909 [Coemansia sp. RSA 2610]